MLHGFFKTQHHQRQTGSTKQAQRQQGKAPVQQVGQQATQRCTQAGNQAQAAQALAHHPGPLHRRIQVAHDGARTHHCCPHGRTLQRAPDNQPAHARRQRAGHRGQHIGGQTDQQNRSAAIAVRQRPPDQLRAAKGQQQGSQGQLRLRHWRGKADRQYRQGGQIQIGGDRLQAQQQR